MDLISMDTEDQRFRELMTKINNVTDKYHLLCKLQTKEAATERARYDLEMLCHESVQLNSRYKKDLQQAIDLQRKIIDRATTATVNENDTNDWSNFTASTTAHRQWIPAPNTTQYHGESQSAGNTIDSSEASANEAVSGLLLSLMSWRVAFYLSENCIDELCSILQTFLKIISQDSPHLSKEAEKFPRTFSSVPSLLQLEEAQMTSIMVCPAKGCHKLYPDWSSSPRASDLTCTNIIGKGAWAKSCDTDLYFPVKHSNGRTTYRPLKTYHYQPLASSLQLLLKRTDFENDCEKWRYVFF